MRASLVGMSFAVNEGEAYYLPFGHRPPGELALGEAFQVLPNLPSLENERVAPLRDLLEDPTVRKIGQDLKRDLQHVSAEEWEMLPEPGEHRKARAAERRKRLDKKKKQQQRKEAEKRVRAQEQEAADAAKRKAKQDAKDARKARKAEAARKLEAEKAAARAAADAAAAATRRPCLE